MAVQYTDLVNKSGTIFNTKTGAGYPNPDALASDLGIKSNQINWGGIKNDPNWSFSTPAPAPAAAAPQTFSFMNEQVSYNPATNTSQVVNSSSRVEEAVNNLGNDLTKVTSKTPDIMSLLEQFKTSDAESEKTSAELGKLYADRAAKLDERRAAELERLNAEYDTEKAKKEDQFTKDIAPYERRLQLLKDTPYGPNASLEEELTMKLDGLRKTHKLEMDTLFNQRQSMIALAQSNYEDKNFQLAEAQLKNAKELESTMYDRQKDYYNIVLDFQAQQAEQQKKEFEQAKSVFEFVNKYGIQQPMFAVGSTVFNSQTLQPEFENIGGQFRRIADGKVYESEKDFFQDSGLTSFAQIQNIDQGGDVERKIVLDLINDYPDAPIYPGMSLTDARNALLESRLYQDKVRPPRGPGSSLVPKESEVRDILFKFKKDYPNLSWAEQWDLAARHLQEVEGLNPTNYDKIFWEIFHEKGIRGYEEKYGKKNSNDELMSAFYTALGVQP